MMTTRFASIGGILTLLLLTACGVASGPIRGTDAARGEIVEGFEVDASRGAVVSVDPVASRVGVEVLRDGGHAVDAAVAVALALAVTWPEAGNIGGGGFMLIHNHDGPASFIDYRETAPASSTPSMFQNDDGSVDTVRARLGFLPVGVPGTVAGLWLAHQRFGRLPWRRLVEPAVVLARDGIVVRPSLHESIDAESAELRLDADIRRIFFDASGAPIATGSLLRQPELAASLKLIAEAGADAFYRGDIATRIVVASQAAGGVLTEQDFRDYRAIEREPLVGHYRGRTILASRPSTSGGTILLESLGILEGFDLTEMGVGSPDELHLLGEALRRAFLDRYLTLGDPDFVETDPYRLFGAENVSRRRDTIDPSHASVSDELAGTLDGTLPPMSEETTHFSIVDAEGNAVSNTYTLEEAWGAKTMATGTGMVLNNEMHDFNVTPGESTRRGRIGTTPNLIEPGKRMLSSLCPAIVLGPDGRPTLIVGSPGGRTIPSTVLRVVTGVIDHGLSLADAIELPRLHHQLYPDRLDLESGHSWWSAWRLSRRGHTIHRRESQGDCHAIGWDEKTGRRIAVADRRRDGGAAAVGVKTIRVESAAPNVR